MQKPSEVSSLDVSNVMRDQKYLKVDTMKIEPATKVAKPLVS